MPLGKTITFRFDGGTWGELRRLVQAADEAGVTDDTEVDVVWDGDGEREIPHVVGIELFQHLD